MQGAPGDCGIGSAQHQEGGCVDHDGREVWQGSQVVQSCCTCSTRYFQFISDIFTRLTHNACQEVFSQVQNAVLVRWYIGS
jgi:hypothetical protein